jgi:hypothetical protein
MFSTLITVALFVSFAVQGTFAGFAINDPPLAACTPVKISWSSGVGPYSLEIVSASDPCGNALQTISGLTSTVYQYTSELKPGTDVLLFVSDSVGNEAWSGNITVGGGSDSCESAAPSSTPVVNNPITQPSQSSLPSNGLGGAINAGSSSGGMLTVHRASTPLLFTALAALLALTL